MRRDFILSMIDQIGDTLRKILQLTDDGDPIGAQIAIDRAMRTATGFDRDFVTKITPDSLASLLIVDKPGESWLEPTCVLIYLLHQQGRVFRALERPEEADNAELKALFLLLTVQKKSPGIPLPEITPTVLDLVRALPTAKIPSFLRKLPHPTVTVPPKATDR